MPRKGENIYKRKDGRWEARYIHHYENGKAKYVSVYGSSYAEAKAKRQEALSCQDSTRISAVKQLADLDEICSLWLNNRKPNVKESTYTRYVRTITKYILPAFETHKLVKICNAEIDVVFCKLKLALSTKTVSDIRCVFKSIWTYGRENGYPCCELKFSKEKSKSASKICVLSPEAICKITAALKRRNDLVTMGIVFTMFTGVRIGELCGLRWGDVDLENGYVHIRRTVERIANLDRNTQSKTKVILSEPKTENSIRIIPLPSCLIEYIKVFKTNDDRYLLTATKKYTEPHTYYSRYKTFLRQNDLGDYTFHELRHTFATQCIDMGFDIKSLSEILGHSNVTTTMNLYVHPTLQMKKRQMDLLTMQSYSPSK